MNVKKSIKNILIVTSMVIASLFFINMSLAVNTAKVTVETANLRETADENSKILELLPIDKEVQLIEKEGNWYKVKVDNIIGYLRQDIISVVEQEGKADDQIESNETTVTNTVETVKDTANAETQEKQIELGKQKIAEDAKLKIVPVINGTETVEVKKNEDVNVTEIINGWVCVETQNTKGWIRKEKIRTQAEIAQEQKEKEEAEAKARQEEEARKAEEEAAKSNKKMYVNEAAINVRAQASTSSEVVTSINRNTEVTVLSENNGWSKIKVNGFTGYVVSNLLSNKKQQTTSRASEIRTVAAESASSNQNETISTTTIGSGSGSSVVSTAYSYMGSRYVYGGSSPSTGFDCSGFTSYVYNQLGVKLNRTAAGQYSNGTAVSRSDLIPGDLVMFGKSGINHVGIYAGGGMIVHAANPSRGVTTDTIESGYYNNNYVGARRIF